MTTLKKQAEDLGIKVDDRWSDATLQAKIDAKRADNGDNGASGPSAAAASGAPVSDDGDKLKTEPTPKAQKAGVILDAKTLLQAKAIELNIEVDPDWDEDRLRGEIQIAREGRADLQVKGAVPPAGMADPDYDKATKADKEIDAIEVKLERDYWDSDDNRIAAGTKVKVARVKARELVANGVATRTDDL